MAEFTREQQTARLQAIKDQEARLLQQRNELQAALEQTDRNLAITSGGMQECEFWIQQLSDEEPAQENPADAEEAA